MRLSGWQRLGIIASVVYALIVFFHEYEKHNKVTVEYAGLMDRICRNSKETEVPKGGAPKDCSTAWTDAYREKGEHDVTLALFVALVPIPFYWLFAWIARFLYRWVRRGFQIGSAG